MCEVNVNFNIERRGGHDSWSERRKCIERIQINGKEIPVVVTDTDEENAVFQLPDGTILGHEPKPSNRNRLLVSTYRKSFERTYTEKSLKEAIEEDEIELI